MEKKETNNNWLLLAGIVGGVILLSSLTKKASAESPKTENDNKDILPSYLLDQFNNKSLGRSVRNNNPGNLKISANNWTGKVPEHLNTDLEFEQFYDKKSGSRAMIKLLNNYITKLGRDTIDKIIRAWSKTDNEAYIRTVLERTGNVLTAHHSVHPDALEEYYTDWLKEISKSIAFFEAGKENLTDAEFEEAYKLI